MSKISGEIVRFALAASVKYNYNMKKYKQLIKQKGLRMNWIAEKLCISPASLSLYLSEQRTMPFDIEARLKNILK